MEQEAIRTENFADVLPECSKHQFRKYSWSGSVFLISIALIVITLTVYMQVGNHHFLNFDDENYVTRNPHVASGISGQNIVWAFTSIEHANWHPLTWLSHMADVEIYGMNPGGHHLTSVAIHSLTALLLLHLLLRLTGSLWRSFFVAVLFALHPLHVESVAWVAERKDVLSAFFWFLTLIFYAEYVSKQKPWLYILSLLAFVLGLMSKPMLVSLPIVMLLFDLWPLGRYRLERGQGLLLDSNVVIHLIKEKIPFFFCSLLSCAITIYAQHYGGAVATLNQVYIPLRIKNIIVSYAKYIGKTLWPQDLAILYPLTLDIPIWQVVISLLILILISVAAIRFVRSHPYFAAGWFWFVITLVPVIGFIQVGSQAIADRYSYLPLIGLFIIVAWGIPEITRNWRHRQCILALLAGTVIFTSAALSWRQLGYWRDSISIYRHTLQATDDNWLIHCYLGNTFQQMSRFDEAAFEYQKSLRINTDEPKAHIGLGDAFFSNSNFDGAIYEYKESLRLDPNNASTFYNLGLALKSRGDLDEAIKQYQEALRIAPNHSKAHNSLGVVFSAKGDLDAAIHQYREALRINPNEAVVHHNLGLGLASKGDLDAAIYEYQEALRLSPNYMQASKSLELALVSKRVH